MRYSSSHPHCVRLVEVELDAVERRGRRARSDRVRRDRAGRPWARTRRGGTRPSSAYLRVAASAACSSRACSVASPTWRAASAAKNGEGSDSRRPTSPPARAHRGPGAAPRRSRSSSRRATRLRGWRCESGTLLHAARDDLPVVVGIECHEVEAAADPLHRAADDAQRAQLLVAHRAARRRARVVRASRRRRCGRDRSSPAHRASARERVAVELDRAPRCASGEKSVSSCSWPAMPASVASIGSSAA